MSDLIKREDVLKQIWEWVTDREFNYTNATHWLQKRIEAIPTIDAVEVVRGEWIKHENPRYSYDREQGDINAGVYYTCSECNCVSFTYNYCPNCGAKMDGEREGE